MADYNHLTFKTIGELFEHGRKCFHKPDGPGAIKALEQVIDQDPAYQHPDGDNPYFYLGKIHEMEDRLDEAVMNYTRSLAVNPLDEESLIGRGSCYTVKLQHEQAVTDFTATLQIPDQQRNMPKKHIFYAIAENYHKAKDWGQAIYWVKKAVNEDPCNQRHQDLLNKLTAKKNR